MKNLYKNGLKSEQKIKGFQRMTVTVDNDDIVRMRELHPEFNVSLFLRRMIRYALEEEQEGSK